jgi:hypothetical protein
MTLLLWILYPIAIQYERGGWWRLCYLVAIPSLLIDVVANYIELAILTLDFPRWGEWTFSKRLSRLQYNTDWRGDFARYLVKCLNAIAPNGHHV